MDYSINIVGAGISGLIAAYVLEKEGYAPTIYEATGTPGGRVKTDIYNGYQLDHGFQVLLDAYPMAKKYLDLDSLSLQKFLPGAVIFHNGKKKILGDPLRNLSLLLPTILSDIGNLTDKIKVLKLNLEVKRMSLEQIFEFEEMSTLAFLKKKGFSDAMISLFFKPFFSGIFLEPQLETSSRMFLFVYKMFGEGLAVLPKSGIGAISEQLLSKLKKTTIHFNSPVQKVFDGRLLFQSGYEVKSDFTLVATEANNLIQGEKFNSIAWKSCDTLYFTAPKKSIAQPLIGLIAESDALVNNIFFHTCLQTTISGAEELLSVTVVKEHQLTENELIDRVKKELHLFCNIGELTFLKRYHIKKALPQLSNLQYSLTMEQTRLSPTTYVAGDLLLNGSLNAAMTAGETAAKAIIDQINTNKSNNLSH